MRVFMGAVSALALVGCATALSEATRVSTGVQAYEFNSIASQYMDRPTFVSLTKDGEGLYIEMDDYGRRYSEYGSSDSFFLAFRRSEAGAYVAAIEKFLEWEETASADGDMLTKEIARVSGYQTSLRFEFHSGNEASHYLVISPCAVGTCLGDMSMYFPPSEAVELKELLQEFGAGNLDSGENLDAKYT